MASLIGHSLTRNAFVGAIITVIIFVAVYIAWDYYPHGQLEGVRFPYKCRRGFSAATTGPGRGIAERWPGVTAPRSGCHASYWSSGGFLDDPRGCFRHCLARRGL